MGRKPKLKPAYTYRDTFPGFSDPRAFEAGDPVGYIIAWSGGLDSTVTLHMAMDVTQDPELVQPFMMALLPDMDYFAFWREYAFKRWQVRVREYQHWAFSWYIRRGTFQLRADPTFPRIIPADIERVVRAETGLHWISYGYKSIDSLQRRGMMNKWEYGVSWDRGVFAPLKDWTRAHVKQYLERKRISQPLAPEYQSRGIDMSPQCMHWLREHWPADYRRMLAAFPMAVAQADRWEALQDTSINSGGACYAKHGRTQEGDGSFPDPILGYAWKPEDQLDDLPLKMTIDEDTP